MDASPRLSRAELALLDRLASEEYGLPVAVLMENAGRGAAEEILRVRREGEAAGKARGPVVVLVGPGNNGGDACVVARHLANAGVPVAVFATAASGSSSRTDASAAELMRRAIERMGIRVDVLAEESDLPRLRAALAGAGIVVDGLLGTGFRGEVRPGMARLIEAVNAARAARGVVVVALDLPSGLDADTGRPAAPTIVADLTVTFAAWKLGFDAPEARPHLGRVVLATIGAPLGLTERVHGAARGRVPEDPGFPRRPPGAG